MNVPSLHARTGLVLSLALTAAAADAATFNVTRFDDPLPGACLPADCSLREAVIAANALPDVDAIMLGAGTYELTQTGAGADELTQDLDIRAPVTIHGLGSALTTVRNAVPAGSSEQRVFEARYVPFGLAGLTVRDGQFLPSPLMPSSGGCLSAIGVSLTLDEVRFTNCQADQGGAVSLVGVEARMQRVSIDTNRASFGGGMRLSGSTVEGEGNTIAGNEALSGGGIQVAGVVGYKDSRIAWSTDSRIVGNIATAWGGGVHVAAGAHLVIEPVAPATVANGDLLLISDNGAAYGGGGISVSAAGGGPVAGSLDARRIRLSGNRSDADGGGLHAGGRFVLSDSELLRNDATADGGGIAVRDEALRSRVERVSFVRNEAGGFGGALSHDVGGLALINSSSYANSAATGGGGFDLRGHADLQQVTSLDDSAPQGASLRFEAPINSRNSVLANGCYTPIASSLIDWGGSVQVTGQPPCTGASYPVAQLWLRYAYFGGRFPVVGIYSPASVLRNAAVPGAYLDMRDIRNRRRSVPTDIGAHDVDALP
jgi:hypothetical protein